MTPEPVRGAELPAAFRLLFCCTAASDQQARVAHALGLVQRGELDAQGLFVVRARRRLLGAVLGLALPGAVGLVWPPQCVPDVDAAPLQDALLRRASDWLRGRNVKVAQALLSSEEARLAGALPRNGFAHVTHLCFLRHDLSFPPGLLETPEQLEYRPYNPSNPALFHQTLHRTYENTLDCPELNEARSVEDVVAGYHSQSRFDPSRWFLAFADGEPIGVLMLLEAPETGDCETSYVGVVPGARRRAYGRELMLKAMTEARAAGASSLTLSVDARNEPARRLYHRLGFESFDRREVFLAVWS
jgi:ribosomal protein S18 acetylase RimI-like enzyme